MKTYGWVLAFGMVAMCAGSGARALAAEYSFAWLDPDKKIYVLQNRKFTKANRPMIMAGGGLGLSNPFRNTTLLSGRVGYYFTEDLGLELLYTYSLQSNNATYNQLRQQVPTSLPTAREFRGQYGALLSWVPWYAKINVFNSILYFDWSFSAGMGQMASEVDINTNAASNPNFVTQTLTAFYLGTGHSYHLTQELDFRLDLLNAFYQAPEFGNSGSSVWFSNLMFTAGLGYRF